MWNKVCIQKMYYMCRTCVLHMIASVTPVIHLYLCTCIRPKTSHMYYIIITTNTRCKTYCMQCSKLTVTRQTITKLATINMSMLSRNTHMSRQLRNTWRLMPYVVGFHHCQTFTSQMVHWHFKTECDSWLWLLKVDSTNSL